MKTNKIISHPYVETLVYSNVFISLCALAQVWLTQKLFQIQVSFDSISYVLFVFLSTYLQYNIQRGYMVNETNVHTSRSQWILKHRKFLLYSIFISLGILLLLCWNLSWTVIGVMTVAEVLATLYYMPPFNFRKYGYIKPFLIGMVWAISCAFVPLYENQMLTREAWMFILAQFTFVSGLSVLFDIKDSLSDQLAGVHTYANALGDGFTKCFASGLFIISALLFYKMNPANLTSTYLNALCMLFSIMIGFLSSQKKHSFYYYLIVDGLMIVQLVVLFQ